MYYICYFLLKYDNYIISICNYIITICYFNKEQTNDVELDATITANKEFEVKVFIISYAITLLNCI